MTGSLKLDIFIGVAWALGVAWLLAVGAFAVLTVQF